MADRLTLVVSNNPKRSSKRAGILYVDSLARMREAVAAHDVERILIDRCASADEYLQLLASLPHEVAGDVMLVRKDGGAFLSSVGRGGDRVMYALSPTDLAFYLQTYGLPTERPALALIA